eukprot:3863888-Alexandrium_andersonii.AAC.1
MERGGGVYRSAGQKPTRTKTLRRTHVGCKHQQLPARPVPVDRTFAEVHPRIRQVRTNPPSTIACHTADLTHPAPRADPSTSNATY